MRTGRGAHANAPHALRAVDAGRAVLFEPEAPGFVRKNHELGHEEIQGRTAAAALNVDLGVFALALERKEPIDAADRLRAASHFFSAVLQALGKVPEPADFVRVGNIKRIALDRFFGYERIDLVVTQVLFDGNALEARLGRFDREGLVLDGDVEREARHFDAFVERKGLHPVFGQHRRLEAGRIDRAHARTRNGVERVVAQNAERGRGNVNAHARATVAQVRNARRVVDFRRFRVVDRKRVDVCNGKVRPAVYDGSRQIRREAAPLREIDRVEAVDVPAPG